MKETFTTEKHVQMSKDIRHAVKLLEQWQQEVWKAWGVGHKTSKRLDKALRFLKNDLKSVMDDAWYHTFECDGRSPYYNPEYDDEPIKEKD